MNTDINPAIATNSTVKWADLGVRAMSAAVLIPAVLFDIWWGGVWFEIFAAMLGVLMAKEWTEIAHGRNTMQFALHAAATLCAAFLHHEVGPPLTVVVILLIAALSSAGVMIGKRDKSVWSYLGVFYVAFPVLALVMLRNDSQWGAHAIVWIMLVVWAADSLAYFAGRIIGGPKLVPVISPKKTWAGLGGAVAGAALAGGLYGALVAPSVLPLALLAGGLAILEQAGDIFESAFKRFHGVKDSGDLIPGHGGVMDRVDGLIAVTVAAILVGYMRNPEATAQGLFLW